MTKHLRRRAASPLATGMIGPPTTRSHRITIPMKVGPSIPLAGFASEVGKKSPFEKYRACVEIETTPDERRVLNAALEAWRATLTEKQRLEWSSPDTVFRRCPVFKKPKAATAEVRPSPYARLQEANAELQIELHEVKRRAADGDLFDLENDRIETIAGTIIEKVGIDKAVKIARAILNSPERNE